MERVSEDNSSIGAMTGTLTATIDREQTMGKHLSQPFHRLVIATAYGVIMLLIYDQLSVFWTYLGFSYRPLRPVAVVLTILFAALPAALLSSTPRSLVPFAAWLLYFTLFMPAMIIPQFQGWLAPSQSVPLFVTTWASTILFIVLARSIRRPISLPRTSVRVFWPAIMIALVTFNLAIIIVFGRSLKLVGFEDVYEQRFASQFGLGGVAIIYVLSNLASAFNPFLIATGIAQKNYWRVLLGIFGQVLVYAAIAGKIVLFSIVVVAATFLVFDRSGRLRPIRLAVGMLSVALLGLPLMAIYNPNGGQLMHFIDLLYLRTLYMPGVTTGAYFDFFSQYPITYFSHSLLGRFLIEYPYGNISVGEIVGSYIVPGSAINYNANFIASDGITGLGIIGIPVVVVLAVLVLRTIEKIVGRVDRRVVCASFMPFLMLLADGSLFTALVTGGGAALTFLLWLWGGTVEQPLVRQPGDDDPIAPMNRSCVFAGAPAPSPVH